MNKETKISKAAIYYLQERGVAISSTETNGNQRCYELSWTSPAGQDVNISVWVDRVYDGLFGDVELELARVIKSAYVNYDPSQEAYYWLGEDGHGKNGAPYTMGAVYNDACSVKDKLYYLYDGLTAFVGACKLFRQ